MKKDGKRGNTGGRSSERGSGKPGYRSSAVRKYNKGHHTHERDFIRHKQQAPIKSESEGIRLNKFLSNAGICSRREADKLIEAGVVEVNGKVVTALGTKVMPTDHVRYGGETIQREKLVYLLLNKPKDIITTARDTHGRMTVLDLVANACKERVFPVGRLDRMTTGLLLLTNDGDLAKKLTHPSHGVKKIYHVSVNKPVSKGDLVKLTRGITLEDGPIKADQASFVEDKRNEIGIEIHSDRNRIIRRMFEHLGYKVTKLDRVYFAGLTKKNLPRGRHRFLSAREVGQLKMLK